MMSGIHYITEMPTLTISESRMSFREKSAWASLAVMLVVFVPYFVHIFRLFEEDKLDWNTVLGEFIGAVVFEVVLLIVVHIVLAVRSKEEEKDERDLAIESKSFKIAYFVLVSSCCVAIPCLIGLGFGLQPGAIVQLTSPVLVSQLLLLCFVAAEASKYVTQLVCYRRGS
jgi:hypothetical protein